MLTAIIYQWMALTHRRTADSNCGNVSTFISVYMCSYVRLLSVFFFLGLF